MVRVLDLYLTAFSFPQSSTFVCSPPVPHYCWITLFIFKINHAILFEIFVTDTALNTNCVKNINRVLQNVAEHGLVKDKGFRVQVAHPHPKIDRVPPWGGMYCCIGCTWVVRHQLYEVFLYFNVIITRHLTEVHSIIFICHINNVKNKFGLQLSFTAFGIWVASSYCVLPVVLQRHVSILPCQFDCSKYAELPGQYRAFEACVGEFDDGSMVGCCFYITWRTCGQRAINCISYFYCLGR